MNQQDLQHLETAIQIAWRAREKGNHPFGALLVDGQNQVLLEAENTVVTERDCTGHAETNLVRLASAQFTTEILARCTMYASTEPCAMCAGAMHWSGISRLVYALSEEALYDIVGPSPDHLYLPSRTVFGYTQKAIEVLGPAAELDQEARAAHAGFWSVLNSVSN